MLIHKIQKLLGSMFNGQKSNLFFDNLLKTSKGQMKSECIYEIIDFPKYYRKYLIDFCPESLCYALT